VQRERRKKSKGGREKGDGEEERGAICLLWQTWTLNVAQIVMKSQLSTRDLYSESRGY